ncbi:RluA family pseudouridine synthase [Paenibacillus terrigena]|uniref:RluA family pseudouridine synthase n=1 Tax=Paenibacillus terrigena TaxID=369333 RepID=UPI0028D1A77E|nr:RluA family pseudouridine synthase [Paenibacillus terrigena]
MNKKSTQWNKGQSKVTQQSSSKKERFNNTVPSRKSTPASTKPRPGRPAPTPPKLYEVHEPTELLTFLIQQINNQGRNAIKSMLSRGQVSVEGQVVTVYNYELKPGQTVTVRKDKIVEAPIFNGLRILHEDEDIIVIQKEAGLLSVSTPQEDELTAYRQLTTYVRVANPQNRIFVVHRLDRDTSGVMMFAKSEKVQQIMQNTWKDIVEERLYVALVEGQVKKPEGTISSWLKENKAMKMYSSPYPNDGQHAVTHYKVLQSNRHFSLLEVHLETGRKNQIRVHMSDIGHPIAGDKKYGSQSKPINRLGLHARVLSFTHPTTGEPLRFESTIPKSFLNPFRQSPS